MHIKSELAIAVIKPAEKEGLKNSNKQYIKGKYQQKSQDSFLYFSLQTCKNATHQVNNSEIKEPDVYRENEANKYINRQTKPYGEENFGIIEDKVEYKEEGYTQKV